MYMAPTRPLCGLVRVVNTAEYITVYMPCTRLCTGSTRLCIRAVSMAVYGPRTPVPGHYTAVYTARAVYTITYTAQYTAVYTAVFIGRVPGRVHVHVFTACVHSPFRVRAEYTCTVYTRSVLPSRIYAISCTGSSTCGSVYMHGRVHGRLHIYTARTRSRTRPENTAVYTAST